MVTFTNRENSAQDPERMDLSVEELSNAVSYNLYSNDTLFVELSEGKVMACYSGDGWYDRTEKYHEYFESELMLSCFERLTKDKAFDLLRKWNLLRSFSYEYDSEMGAMVRNTRDGMPLIIRKMEPRWKELGGLDDSYSRAIYIGQGCWERLDTIDEEKAQQILSEWGHSERMQKFFDLMKARHSVRQYLDKPIPEEVREELDEYTRMLNIDSALNMQIIYDEPECFSSAKAKYGSFKGCTNYISVVADKHHGDLEMKCGYYGELLVLKAQELGLNTCWVALTHGKSKAVVKDSEEEVIIISLGYGITQGTERKSKKPESVSNISPGSPEWFKRGIDVALLAPTAINQQKFKFTVLDNKVYLESGKIGPCLGIDLGIVRCHFELGAGRENFEWEYKPLKV